VWNPLKQGLKSRMFLSLTNLTQAVLEQINILKKQRLVQAFFHKKEIGFFTNKFTHQ